MGALRQAMAAGEVTEVRLTISAADMPARTVPLANEGGAWGGVIGQLPAGTNRTFAAEALDASGKRLFQGQATGVTILADKMVVVALTLQQVDAPPSYGNAVPCITSLTATPSIVVPGGSVSLVATAKDLDAADTLSYAWTANAGGFSAPDSLSTTWTAPSVAGPVSLTLTVTDAQGATATLGLTITVRATGESGADVEVSFNSWPAVTRITAAPYSVEVGETTTVTASVSDGDGDTLSYQWKAGCAGTWTDASSATARFTPSAQPAGDTCANCPLTVTASDGRGGTATGTLSICVGPRTQARFPPDILYTFQSQASAPAGSQVTFRVEVQDAQNSALTFAWHANVGTLGAPVDTATASEVVWTAPDCVLDGTTPTLQFTVTNALGLSNTTQFTAPGAPACGSMACEDGLTDCGGVCSDLDTDVAHCGACNQRCRSGETCQEGSCVCTEGQVACFGTCTSLSSDPNNCGACGRRCSAGAACSSGACVTPDCTATDGSCHSLAPGASSYKPWELVTVQWTAPTGHSGWDSVRLYRLGAPDSSPISSQDVGSSTSGTLTFAAPTTAGTYEFRYLPYGSSTSVKSSTPFTVELGTSGVHSLAPGASTYKPWELVTVQWAAPAHHNKWDTVRLYRVGAPDSAHLEYYHVGVDAFGTLTFAAPTTAGTYEFRYVLTESNTVVRTSAPFTVELGTSGVHSLAPGASTYKPWELVTVQWTAPAHHHKWDTVRLYRVGAPDSAHLEYYYVGVDAFGTLTFAAPTTAGTYEFRYVLTDSNTVVKTSAPFTVELGTSGVHSLAPGASTYKPWELVTVQWTAPAHHHKWDTVRIYRVGAPDTAHLDYQYVGVDAFGTLTFAAPTTAGTYEFRYILNDSNTVVRTSAPFTVELGTSDVHTLTLDASTYSAGSTITAHWTAPAHHHRDDTVRLYRVGASDTAHLEYQYVGVDAFGTLTFTAPATAGSYELRYVLNGTSTVVKTSAPFTVSN